MADNRLSFFSKIITAALALLGFSSCGSTSEWCEYGVPSATFRVTGRVVDKETSKPVEGIRAVLVSNQYGDLNKYYSDTLHTSADGMFDLKVHSYPENPVEFLLEIKDVDGEANGSYATKETDIVFENPEYVGSDSWYVGEATKEVGDVDIEQVAEE